MLDFLAEIEAPTVVVLTKIDKLRAREVPERTQAIAHELGLDADQVIAFSAESGQGRDELAEAVVSLMGQPSWRAPS